MNKQTPSYLRLVTDTSTELQPAVDDDLVATEQLAAAFEYATGWRIEFAVEPIDTTTKNLMWSAPVNPGVGAAPGHIRLFSQCDVGGGTAGIELNQAIRLAEAVGGVWGDLVQTRRALREREAELAVGVPLIVREDDLTSLGERLEAVLQGGAEAIGCQAAALYLLDSGTTELKLRSSWGLSEKRLLDPARPLRGSLADLEALLGHAVVLTNNELNDYWKVPQADFSSYVCVPVSTPSMPLGTLWAFCRDERDFSDAQTNILEVVAGRLAADLERQVLVNEATVARGELKRLNVFDNAVGEELPSVVPVIEGWEVAAEVFGRQGASGTFYDWFSLDSGRKDGASKGRAANSAAQNIVAKSNPARKSLAIDDKSLRGVAKRNEARDTGVHVDGSLVILAGDAVDGGMASALAGSALRAAARAFVPPCADASLLLEKANSILWTTSSGNRLAGLFQAILRPGAASPTIAAAGPLRVLMVRADGWLPLVGPSAPLGQQEELRCRQFLPTLDAGQLLLIFGTNFLELADERALAALDEYLARAIQQHLGQPVRKLIERAGAVLQSQSGQSGVDRLLLAIRRRPR